MPPTVTVLHDADKPPGLQGIERDFPVRYSTGEGLAEALTGAEVLFVWDFRSRALADAWASADALRWVHAASAGVDHVLVPGVLEGDVVVTNSRGVFDQPMAEYVLGAILALAKDLPTTVRAQAERRWVHRETERIAGKRALVVGTGPIGRATARLLAAAGLVVTGVGRTARASDPDFGRVLDMSQYRDALPDTDFLVLAAPLTAQTRGMIDSAALAALPNTARLVNVGRGPLVVAEALVDALADGEIAGAALDVFDVEPLPADSPLWTMPNVVVSPHMSGDVVGWRDELVALFADNLARFTQDRPLRNVVDKRRGYVPSKESHVDR